MSKVLIIGAGGVGQVVTHKCAQRRDIFNEITLASRTKVKCDAIAAQLDGSITTAQVDADNVPELVALIKQVQPKLVINVALPYQDLHIMDACLETGVDYLDTANYEPLDTARFEYSWQWAYQDRFRQAGIMALLGSGFDPGVTNVYTALAAKKYLEKGHGLYVAGSKEIGVPGLALHGGLNVPDFDNNYLFSFLGLNYTLEEKVAFMVEYDNMFHDADPKRLNAGIRFYITPYFQLDMAAREIGADEDFKNGWKRKTERIVQMRYTTSF